MANDPSFPPALKDLAKSGIGVAAAPTGGMGFALTPDGKIPAGVLFLASAGTRRIACGITTLTWPGGSVFGNFITITHGLGAVPVTVIATPAGASGLTQDPLVGAFSADATTFQLRGETVDAQAPLNTAASSAYWLAIG